MLTVVCSLAAISFTSHAVSLSSESETVSTVKIYIDSEIKMKTLQSVFEEIKEIQRAKIQAEQAALAMEFQRKQEMLAAIIFCEAGNQPYEGQLAVGAVVMNRVKSNHYPNDIEAVIYQSGQFSPVSTGWFDQVRSSGSYTTSAMQAAADVLSGANPVGDCLYFDKGGYGMKIGDHYFH